MILIYHLKSLTDEYSIISATWPFGEPLSPHVAFRGLLADPRVFPPPPNPTGAPWGPHPHPPWGWGIDFEKPRGWGILTETPWGFGGGFTWFFILFRQKKLAFLLIFEEIFLYFCQKFFQHPPFYFIKSHFVTVYNKNYD